MTRTRNPVAASSTLPPRRQRDFQPGAGESAVPGQPFPIDHTRPMRFVRPLPPRDIARILNEAGYSEPVDVPSRAETIMTYWVIVLSVGVVIYFGGHFILAAIAGDFS